MIRFSQKGLDLAQAKAVVDGLMKRRFPLSEEIDGRVYVNLEHMQSVIRPDNTEPKAKMAVKRIRQFTDRDANGNLLLRATGIRKAESLLAAANDDQA